MITEPTSPPSGLASPSCSASSVHFSSASDDWPTPQDFFDRMNALHGPLELDVCASPTNAKCPRYYTRADDGLAQPWSGVCWMNPPYGREMVAWLKRAEAEKANGVTTVALIPSRTNTGWWHDIVMPNEVRFVRGRPKFGNADQGLPWPLAVVIYRPRYGSVSLENAERRGPAAQDQQ